MALAHFPGSVRLMQRIPAAWMQIGKPRRGCPVGRLKAELQPENYPHRGPFILRGPLPKPDRRSQEHLPDLAWFNLPLLPARPNLPHRHDADPEGPNGSGSLRSNVQVPSRKPCARLGLRQPPPHASSVSLGLSHAQGLPRPRFPLNWSLVSYYTDGPAGRLSSVIGKTSTASRLSLMEFRGLSSGKSGNPLSAASWRPSFHNQAESDTAPCRTPFRRFAISASPRWGILRTCSARPAMKHRQRTVEP